MTRCRTKENVTQQWGHACQPLPAAQVRAWGAVLWLGAEPDSPSRRAVPPPQPAPGLLPAARQNPHPAAAARPLGQPARAGAGAGASRRVQARTQRRGWGSGAVALASPWAPPADSGGRRAALPPCCAARVSVCLRPPAPSSAMARGHQVTRPSLEPGALPERGLAQAAAGPVPSCAPRPGCWPTGQSAQWRWQARTLAPAFREEGRTQLGDGEVQAPVAPRAL